jgi:hypothetical protein
MTGLVGGAPALPYISGNFFQPIGQIATGAVTVTGHIALIPFVVRAPVTITRSGVHIITVQAASNVQQAFYANNPATGRPTGNALATVASLSCASAVTIDGALSANLPLLPFTAFWYGINTDTSGIAFSAISGGNGSVSSLLGTSTLANVISGANLNLAGLDVTQAFNTWPDLTGASFTEQVGGTWTGAVPIMKAA